MNFDDKTINENSHFEDDANQSTPYEDLRRNEIPDEPLKVGDRVRIGITGPAMTILAIHKDQAWCAPDDLAALIERLLERPYRMLNFHRDTTEAASALAALSEENKRLRAEVRTIGRNDAIADQSTGISVIGGILR